MSTSQMDNVPTTTAEGSFELSDKLKVYTQTWKTQLQTPLAYAFFLHGFSDHCNAYYTFFPILASRGIEVFSFDQRGWGRTCTTVAQRGLTGPNSQLLKDIDELLHVRLELAKSHNRPLFLLGHSNGGGIALFYSVFGTYRGELAGVVAQSPLLLLAPNVRPLFITVAAGKLAAKILPNHQMVNKLDPKSMSRDPEVCRKFEEDPLCHDTGTLLGLSEMMGRGKTLMKKEEGYGRYPAGLPLLIVHGTGDMVTDCEASRRFVEGVGAKDKSFVTYEGWYHKMHAEPGEDKIKFANDIAGWILKRAALQSPQAAAAAEASSSASAQPQAQAVSTTPVDAKL